MIKMNYCNVFLCLFLNLVFSTQIEAQIVGNGVADFDGYKYQTVIIGKQEWMSENLRTSHYANGDVIPNIQDSLNWDTLTIGAWVYYANDSLHYAQDYGKYFNFAAAVDSRNVCPTNWRVPSEADWDSLSFFLGGPWAAGGKLKDTLLWNSPNAGGTNSTGFNARPGGNRVARYPSGGPSSGPIRFVFENVGDYAYYWSIWNQHPTTRRTWELEYNRTLLWDRNTSYKTAANIRCMRDTLFSTSINNIEKTQSLYNIFPNPTRGSLTISTEDVQVELEIRLYSLYGQLLEVKYVTKSNQISFDINGGSGIYFLEIKNHEGTEIIERIIKK